MEKKNPEFKEEPWVEPICDTYDVYLEEDEDDESE